MIYVKINGNEYIAEISGLMNDYEWDNRESKTIVTRELTYEQAMELFVDGCSWSIICEDIIPNENQPVREEFDNSDFNVAGPITNYRDGRISIKMGKTTDLEDVLELLLGEVNNES